MYQYMKHVAPSRATATALMVLASMAAPVSATNLVKNGGFEMTQFDPGASSQFTTQVDDWLNAVSQGRAYLFFPNTATTTGAAYTAVSHNYTLVLAAATTSPANGNFIGIDSDTDIGGIDQSLLPITQTITDLTPGRDYDLSFWWAAAQEKNVVHGQTTDKWVVSLIDAVHNTSETFETPVITIPDQGFSGWMKQTFTYKATNATEVLEFLARGTPSGLPPFALLDDVQLQEAPEPASLLLMVGGFAAIAGLRRQRRRAAA